MHIIRYKALKHSLSAVDYYKALENEYYNNRYVDGMYTGGRNQAEMDILANDPAHAGSTRQIDIDKGIHERKVGLDLEETRRIDGPITRDPSGDAEFFDRHGQALGC